MAQIEIENLGIRYQRPKSNDTFTALAGITHSIEKGSFVTIVGGSGCGKSSLLMAITRLLCSIPPSCRPHSPAGPSKPVLAFILYRWWPRMTGRRCWCCRPEVSQCSPCSLSLTTVLGARACR